MCEACSPERALECFTLMSTDKPNVLSAACSLSLSLPLSHTGAPAVDATGAPLSVYSWCSWKSCWSTVARCQRPCITQSHGGHPNGCPVGEGGEGRGGEKKQWLINKWRRTVHGECGCHYPIVLQRWWDGIHSGGHWLLLAWGDKSVRSQRLCWIGMPPKTSVQVWTHGREPAVTHTHTNTHTTLIFNMIGSALSCLSNLSLLVASLEHICSPYICLISHIFSLISSINDSNTTNAQGVTLYVIKYRHTQDSHRELWDKTPWNKSLDDCLGAPDLDICSSAAICSWGNILEQVARTAQDDKPRSLTATLQHN